MKYGLIGEKLGHSFSKIIHEKIADYTYELKEIAAQDLPLFLKERAFKAMNVTVPYKQTIMDYLDEISPEAQAIGAVNTVVNRGGELWGYNTDFYGLCALIRHADIFLMDKKVAILGTGGTSKTAIAVAI